MSIKTVNSKMISEKKINQGMLLGFLGVVLFSLTLPVNRLIIGDFDPVFIGMGRSVLAACVTLPILLYFKQKFPSLRQVKLLLLTAIGIIAGFPVLTALAMQTVPASHGSVVIGLLPLLTAMLAVIISDERPSIGFWIASFVGALLVITYSLLQGGLEFHLGDIYLVGARILGAYGYAMGGQISKEMGGWQVICWVNVLALPITIVISWWLKPNSFSQIPFNSWMGFVYLALASQLFGFFLWYKGLVMGGIARVSQTQLLQPFLSIIAAILLLNEEVGMQTYIFAMAVVMAIAITRKMQVKEKKS